MQIFASLKEARTAEEAGEVFVEIRRITDDEWHAYEPGDEIPPPTPPTSAQG